MLRFIKNRLDKISTHEEDSTQNAILVNMGSFNPSNVATGNNISDEYEKLASKLMSYIIPNAYSKPPRTFFDKFLLSHSVDELFKFLEYIFLHPKNKIRSPYVTTLFYNYKDLCLILLECKIEPINSWLSIIYNGVTSNNSSSLDFSIRFLCETFPEDVLKQFVLDNFNNILTQTHPSDYVFFCRYPEWQEAFGNHLDLILNSNELTYQEFLNIIENYPQFSVLIYKYILESYIESIKKKSFSKTVWSEFSIVEDILIPIVRISQNPELVSMPDILKMLSKSILLDTLTFVPNFPELYEAQRLLEEEFNIDSNLTQRIVFNRIEEYINNLMVTKIDILNHFDTLDELLKNAYAYDYFMDNLSEILSCQGIYLYAYLIASFGNRPQIVRAEKYCPELQ